jgi:hypothetical protein
MSVDALQVAQLPSANHLACYCVPLQRLVLVRLIGSIACEEAQRSASSRPAAKPDFADCHRA